MTLTRSTSVTSTGGYTFVTVYFEGEGEFIALQARSMAKFCPVDLVYEIIVIENGPPGSCVPFREELLLAYGHLSNRVVFYEAGELADIPEDMAGWFSQQILKMRASEWLVETTNYVVLDAKNFLFRPLDRSFLETADGRKVLMNAHPYTNHPLRKQLEMVLDFWGLPSSEIEHFPRTSTPFIVYTGFMKRCIEVIESKTDTTLELFMMKTGMTEFFLYSGYVISEGLANGNYDLNQPWTSLIWSHEAGDDVKVHSILKQIEEPKKGPFFGFHRGAIPKFSPLSIARLQARLIDWGVASHSQAVELFAPALGKEV